MNLKKFAGLTALGCAVVVLGTHLAGANPVVRKNTSKFASNEKMLIGQLHQTAVLLQKADHDYKGHRAAAVGQIHKAIHELRASIGLKGGGKKTPSTNGGAGEAQGQSDGQLQQAIKQLHAIHAEIKGLTPTPRRAKAAEHIHHAIKELKIALSIA